MAYQKFSAGEIIFSEGDVADVAYTVLSGSVEMSYLNNGAEIRLGTAGKGKVFGEMGIVLPDEMRPYTARAAEDSVVQPITPEEFEKLFYQCPPQIQPYLMAALEKITPVKSRAKAPAAAISRNDISRITISPASDNLKAQLKPVEIPVTSLPFRIGGYPEDGKKTPRDQLHLAIASLKNPLLISHQHCEIALDGHGNVAILDLGSRFCTTVNGVMIGRGRGMYSTPLQKGANDIYLGSEDSKYRLAITCK